MERSVLSTWLIRVDSLIEPARRGWERCFGRAEEEGVVVFVEVEEGVGEEMGMKPPAVSVMV